MEVRRLRDKLVLASLVLIVPFVIWNVLQQLSRFREIYLASISSNQEVARDVAGVFTSHVYNLVDIEHTIGLTLWGEHGIPRSASSDYLKSVADDFPSISYVSAADANGYIYASSSPAFIGLHQANHPTLRKVMEGAGWALSDVFTHAAGEKDVFGIVVGIRDKAGRLQGMVLVLMDEEDLTRALGREIMSPALLVITDSKGIVALVHGDKLARHQRDWSKLPFIKRALAGHPEVVEKLRMPNGRVMLGSVEPIHGLGWTASVWRCRQEVLGPVRRQAVMRGLMVLMFAGLAIGAALILGNRLSQPVLDLAQTAHKFGEGDLGARADISTRDEVEFLGDSFNQMASTLQERTSQLNDALGSERRQSERANQLYSVAQGLVTALELKERLQVIASALASVCHAKRSVIMLRTGNRFEVVAGHGGFSEDSNFSLDLGKHMGAMPIEQALEKGEPLLVQDVAMSSYMSPGLAAALRIKGYLALPLVSHGRKIGVVFMDNPDEPPIFDQEAIQTARILAELAAIAIENAQVFERERNIAHVLQKSLLPEICDKFGKFRIACEYHAALEEAQLGGDFYDLVSLPDGRIGVVIADVSGKGLEAAVSTAMGKYTMRAVISEVPDPGAVLTRVNKALLRMGSEWGFMTLFYGLLDLETGVFSSSNAGHPPPVLVRESGEIVLLPRLDHQPPLAAFPDIEYLQIECRLAVGDVLACYTDGVLEAGRDHDPFEIDRLTLLVTELRHLAPAEIASGIYNAVAEYSGNIFRDDIALMVIKREEA